VPVIANYRIHAIYCIQRTQYSAILINTDRGQRSRALTSLQLGFTPTPAPSGEVPLCMVHKAAQEASRRTTPARALAHAAAPSLDRTSPSHHAMGLSVDQALAKATGKQHG
jgi:hypothetical protein